MQSATQDTASSPERLSARQAIYALRNGTLTSVALMQACLGRIRKREVDVRAWSHIDEESAMQQAQAADALRAKCVPVGLLHGLPIGVKDVFDTADMPSEYGAEIYRGRRPRADAAAVTRLREAGAIIVGKTATSEFGMYHPSQTRNPHDLSRSPGVSSAGSAAAVVDYMVPLALGTQHTASTTLPASFCGAHAFKPSLGFADMSGSNILVPRLAHLGFLARSVDDLALFAGVFDSALNGAAAETVAAPRLAFVRSPGWSTVLPHSEAALQSLLTGISSRGNRVDEAVLPIEFDDALAVVMGILDTHLAFKFGNLPAEEMARLCPPLRAGIETGRATSAVRYLERDAQADRLGVLAAELFVENDILVTLSTPSEATRLEDGPGSGAMSMPWSLCGLPTVSLPLLKSPDGLPIGVQLIAAKNNDRFLLQSAAWFAAQSNLSAS